MNNKRAACILFTFFLFTLVSFNTHAQETKTLTLKDAIDLSIKNSKQLQLSKARIDEAVAATKEATQRRLPDLNISANYLQFSNAKVKSAGKDTTAIAPLGINSALYGTANITYPIFTGFKIKYGIESAEYLEQATKLDATND